MSIVSEKRSLNGCFHAKALGKLWAVPSLILALGWTSATALAQSKVTLASARSELEQPAKELDDLAEIMRGASARLQPKRIPTLELAAPRLSRAIADFDQFVGAGTAAGDAWHSFLRLDEVVEQLDSERPNWPLLTEIQMNMQQNYPGLEFPKTLELRESLTKFVRAAKYGRNPTQTVEVINRRIDQLIQSLDGDDPTIDEAAAMAARITTYLHESEQDPELVAQIREIFDSPNVQVQVTERFLNRLAGRAIAEPSPVNECLLGTRVVGDSCTLGNLFIDLHPMFGGASLNLNMNATMSSQNKGYNRGVVLFSTATSPIWASKHVTITPSSITSSPASVATDLRTQILSIQHKLRIVRRIAKRKAAEQKPKADAIAQGRLQNRVRAQYDETVEEQLNEARVQLAGFQTQRPEMKRLGMPRPLLAVDSSENSVDGNVVQAASFQLAANQSCQLPLPSDVDLTLRLHQSALTNAFDILFSGRTLRSAELDNIVGQFTDDVPEEITLEAENEVWTIKLASYRPIEIGFKEGRIAVTVRITSMEGANGDVPKASSLTVTYLPVQIGQPIVLQREGDVVASIGAGGSQATALKAILRKKFDTVFKDRIELKNDDLLRNLKDAPNIHVRSLELADGWIQVGIK